MFFYRKPQATLAIAFCSFFMYKKQDAFETGEYLFVNVIAGDAIGQKLLKHCKAMKLLM